MLVLPEKDTLPPTAVKLGSSKSGNNATATHCDYEALILELKAKAAALGGNLVKITKLEPPVFISKCYKVDADVYKIDVLPNYDLRDNTSEWDTSIRADTESAIIYLYRMKDTLALEPPYKVYLDDTIAIGRMHANSRTYIKTKIQGDVTLDAKIEKKVELKLSIRHGEQYYIRCGLKNGEFTRQPMLELMDNATGEAEYNAKKEKHKKDVDVKYLEQAH